MGLISFFLKLFNFKPKWNGTPEMFLGMVMEMQSRNNKVYSVREVLQWGEVMQKVINVNLSPYKDFTDLMIKAKPDFSMVEKLRDKLDEVNHRRELKKALYGENADLGEDDVMKSNDEGSIFARKMVKDLSKYVQFPDEDQRTIDNI